MSAEVEGALVAAVRAPGRLGGVGKPSAIAAGQPGRST
jgi:hypothetical protein